MPLQLFRLECREIGELMLDTDSSGTRQIIDYHAFVKANSINTQGTKSANAEESGDQKHDDHRDENQAIKNPLTGKHTSTGDGDSSAEQFTRGALQFDLGRGTCRTGIEKVRRQILQQMMAAVWKSDEQKQQGLRRWAVAQHSLLALLNELDPLQGDVGRNKSDKLSAPLIRPSRRRGTQGGTIGSASKSMMVMADSDTHGAI
jgi:hypothetical protein